MNWILDRLKEPSTWKGIALLASVAGIAVNPEQWEAISAAVVAIIGVIEVFRKEPEVRKAIPVNKQIGKDGNPAK